MEISLWKEWKEGVWDTNSDVCLFVCVRQHGGQG